MLLSFSCHLPQLQDFSFVVTLPKLERLEAADNKIAGLPQDFDKLRNLAYLDITNNEGLSELPPGKMVYITKEEFP